MSDVLRDPAEPLESLATRDRVYFTNGQLLDAADFRDEQTYHRSRLALLLSYLTGPGTLAGAEVLYEGPLEAGEDPEHPAGRPERVRVTAGVVVDRLGRLIEIPRSACLRLDEWYGDQEASALNAALALGGDAVVVDIFVGFHACGRGRTPSFSDEPGGALDKVAFSRLRDGFFIEAVLRDNGIPEPPADRWAAIAGEATPEARLAKMQELILGGWHHSTDAWQDDGSPPAGREHDATQDPASVFLARLRLSAAMTPFEGDGPAPAPIRTEAGGKPVVSDPDNAARLFVYPTAALRHLITSEAPAATEGGGEA